MGSEYKLDFTLFLSKDHIPSYSKAASAYTQTVNQAPIQINFRQQKPGVFILKTFNAKDSEKIEHSKVRYSYGSRNKKEVLIPFKKLEPWKFYENPKWITIDGLYDSGLRLATDSDFDQLYSKYGDIIVKAHDDKEIHGMKNGRKKLRIDLKVDIERFIDTAIDVETESGDVKRATGRIKTYYQGQPVMCRECSVKHIGKCPEKVKREAEEKEREDKRKSEINTFVVGDSNLRRLNEKSLRAKTDCATGAKIGHVANTLSFEEGHYDHIIIHAGQNNVDVNPDTNLEEWEAQTNYEITQLKSQLVKPIENGTKVVVVGISNSPWCEYTAKSKKMKKSVNRQLGQLVNEINFKQPDYAAFVTIENDRGSDYWEDDRHMTELMSAKMIETVNLQLAKWSSVNDNQFIIRGIKLTSDRKYGAVNATYRVGCGKCTRLGHGEDSCTVKAISKKHKLSSVSDDEQNPRQKTKI